MVIILSHGVGIRFALFVAEAYALFAHLHRPVDLSVYRSKLQASCRILTQWDIVLFTNMAYGYWLKVEPSTDDIISFVQRRALNAS